MLIAKVLRTAGRWKKEALRRWVHCRAFSSSARHRVLLVSFDPPVARSQIDPFHFYAGDLRREHGAEIREAPVEAYLRGERPAARGATLVCFQTSYDIPRADLSSLVALLKAENPEARLVYLDWTSPLDTRLAGALAPHISLYVKKHLFRDRARCLEATFGDTNLVDHYSKRFGIDQPWIQPRFPESFFDQLIVGPSFVTADYIRDLARGRVPATEGRTIDVHARFAVTGPPWYRGMRSDAAAALDALADLDVVHGGHAHPIAYLRELRASKMCLSPFGYGEVCWRDYEAAVSGAVLLKPDMSHVETDPDIFVPGETYVPLRWDFADLDDKVRWLRERPTERERIAANAFAVLHDYVTRAKFVRWLAPVLEGAPPRPLGPARGRESAVRHTRVPIDRTVTGALTANVDFELGVNPHEAIRWIERASATTDPPSST